MTISANDGLELIQMVLERVTGPCVSEDADPQRRWIMWYHIAYKGMKTSRQVLKPWG